MKDMPKDELPREKAIKYGFNSLSDAELLAILLRTGTKDLNVIIIDYLSRRISVYEKLRFYIALHIARHNLEPVVLRARRG